MIFTECLSDANQVIFALKDSFEITIGSADTFVDIQISRDRGNKTMTIHQEAYAYKMIKRFNVILMCHVIYTEKSISVIYRKKRYLND